MSFGSCATRAENSSIRSEPHAAERPFCSRCSRSGPFSSQMSFSGAPACNSFCATSGGLDSKSHSDEDCSSRKGLRGFRSERSEKQLACRRSALRTRRALGGGERKRISFRATGVSLTHQPAPSAQVFAQTFLGLTKFVRPSLCKRAQVFAQVFCPGKLGRKLGRQKT